MRPRGCGGNGGAGLGSSGGSEAARPVCRARVGGWRYLMGPAGGAASRGRHITGPAGGATSRGGQGALSHVPAGAQQCFIRIDSFKSHSNARQ